MSEPTYTKKEILKMVDAAIINSIEKNHNGGWLQQSHAIDSLKKDILSELQRPAYVPEDGEMYLYFSRSAGWYVCEHTEGAEILQQAKPLTRTMCGPVGRALGVAVDALHNIRKKVKNTYGIALANGWQGDYRYWLSRNNCTRVEITDALSEIKRLEESNE